MMEGLDDDWNHVGNRRYASYTTLPPGNYTFRIKASNNDGIWNDQGTSLKITITPPFWQTWWFTSLFVLFVLAMILLFLRWRVHKIQVRCAEDNKWIKLSVSLMHH